MRKVYTNPELFYEDFTLMDAITASCMIPAQHADKYTCAWYNEDSECNVFTEFVSNCEFIEVAHEIPQDVVFPS